MALNCGIVGLPNVGKSTLFTALTSLPAEASNYPFCTIEPNIGRVAVPDERLQQIAAVLSVGRTVPTSMEFIDIAGLAPGAARGEGLGNRFLAHIRETNLIVHVVRCFDDPDVSHVGGGERPDPRVDLETIETELLLADLETIARRRERISRDPALRRQVEALTHIEQQLSAGTPARALQAELVAESAQDNEQDALLQQLLTAKQQLIVCNVDEATLNTATPDAHPYEAIRATTNSGVIAICATLEAEIAALESAEERFEFLQSAGLSESGLGQLIREAYRLLGLRTFFTNNPNEVRAWTFHEKDSAATAGGYVHSDFERGFICAETFHCSDLSEHGSIEALRRAGKLRREGRDYQVRDGDIIHFRFHL